MTARLLFSTGSLYVLDTADCFQLAAEAGFDGIEIMCDSRFSTRDPHYLNHLSQVHNLPVLAAHTPFSTSVPGWDHHPTHLDLIRHTLRLAEAIGAESIIVHLPLRVSRGRAQFGRRDLQFPWFSDFSDVRNWMIGQMAGVQQRSPVKIAVENMPAAELWGRKINPAHWNHIEQWSRVHDHLTLDTTHWATWGIDPVQPYRAAKSRVAHVHLSNFDGREHRLPHQGDVDLGAFLRVLAADSFSGTVSLEVNPDALAYESRETLRRNLRDSLDFMRQHLSGG